MKFNTDEIQPQSSILSVLGYLLKRLLGPIMGVTPQEPHSVPEKTVEVKDFRMYTCTVPFTLQVLTKPLTEVSTLDRGSAVRAIYPLDLNISSGDVLDMNSVMLRHNKVWYFRAYASPQDTDFLIETSSGGTYSLDVPEHVLGEELISRWGLDEDRTLEEQLWDVDEMPELTPNIDEVDKNVIYRISNSITCKKGTYAERGSGPATTMGNGIDDIKVPVKHIPANWGSFRGDGSVPELAGIRKIAAVRRDVLGTPEVRLECHDADTSVLRKCDLSKLSKSDREEIERIHGML